MLLKVSGPQLSCNFVCFLIYKNIIHAEMWA